MKRRKFMVDCGKMSGVTALAGAVNLSVLSRVGAQTISNGSDYRALVNIVLGGGIDSMSFVAPGTDEEFQHYTNIRSNNAFSKSSFTNTSSANDGNIRFHNKLSRLRKVFEDGDLAVVAGVGTLVTPLTKENKFRGPLPSGIGSHFDQSVAWQNSVPNLRGGSIAGTGWIGRMMEILNDSHNATGAFNPMIDMGGGYSLRGFRSKGIKIDVDGPDNLQLYGSNRGFRDALDGDLEATYSTVLKRHIQHTRKENIESMDLLDRLAKNVNLRTNFPNTNLGQKLKNVAIYIALRNSLGLSRQVFSVSDGGHDTHSRNNDRVEGAMSRIDEALNAFNDAMKELGVHDGVVSYISSDFGRTFTANNSGTNHGWAAHTMVMGGPLRNRRVIGGFPSYAPDADIHQGVRPLPQLSTDQLFASLAYWYGIDNDGSMENMLPNIRNFRSRSSGAENANDPFLDMFKNSALVGRRG